MPENYSSGTSPLLTSTRRQLQVKALRAENGGGGGTSGSPAQMVTYTSGTPATPANPTNPAWAYDPTGILSSKSWDNTALGTRATSQTWV